MHPQQKKDLDQLVAQAQFAVASTYQEYKKVLIKKGEQLPVNQKPTKAIDPFWMHTMRLVGLSDGWDMEQAQLNATGLRSTPKASVHHKPSNSYEDAKLNAAKI